MTVDRFIAFFYYQTLADRIKIIFFVFIFVRKNQKQRRKTPKQLSKATFFKASRISLVNQKYCYHEKMTSQLKEWENAGILDAEWIKEFNAYHP